MMSIAKLNSVDYLFKHSQHEYFTEADNEKGTFTGRLARYQKLEGKEADQKNFERLCSYGKDFLGVEIDPSPPKDWSILINRVSPEERRILEQGYKDAVKNLCTTIEQNTFYRKTENGVTEHKLAKGVCMAVFDHHTARPVDGQTDMQEHSHIVIFPKVLGDDGKFYSHTLLDLKYEKNGHETLKYFDATFQHDLVKCLNSLGYTVSPDKNGNFKIDGISDELRRDFSKRTNKGEEVAGKDASYSDKKQVMMKQRQAKEGNDLTILRKSWTERMDELGYTKEAAEKSKGKQQDKSKSLDETLDKEKSVVSSKRLKTIAIQQAMFSGKEPEEFLKKQEQSKSVLKVGKNFSANLRFKSFKPVAQQLKTGLQSALKAKASPKASTAPSTQTAKATTTTSNPIVKIDLEIMDATHKAFSRLMELNGSSSSSAEFAAKAIKAQKIMSELSQTLDNLMLAKTIAYMELQKKELSI